MNASSSDACCGVSSCSDDPVLRPRPRRSARRSARAPRARPARRPRHVTSGPRRGRASCVGLRRADAHDVRRTPVAGTPSTLVSAISRPRPMTIRWSAVSAISLIRCEETKTVRPSAARPFSRLRIQWMPSGSRPLTGSSSITVCGSPSSAEAMPSRWPMPSENSPARLRRDLAQADEVDQLVDAAPRDAVRLREREQVVVGRAAGVDGARLEQRADLVQRRRVVAVVLAVHGDRRRPSARRGRGSGASSSTCPSRSARGSRSRLPGRTVKLRPSTARLSP